MYRSFVGLFSTLLLTLYLISVAKKYRSFVGLFSTLLLTLYLISVAKKYPGGSVMIDEFVK